MGTNVSKENLKRKTDFSDSSNQSKRFKHPAPGTPNNGDIKNLIPFSWQNGLSSSVTIDREGMLEARRTGRMNIFMFNEGLKESTGMTNKSLNDAESASSVSMIVNLDESEDVDVDIEAEAEVEITEDTRKCY